MKSRKKWSIPIALAVVLMLAAVVGLAGIVQAHNTDSRNFSTNGNNNVGEVIGSIGHTGIVAKDVDNNFDGNPIALGGCDVENVAGVVDDADKVDDQYQAEQDSDNLKCELSPAKGFTDADIGTTHNIVVTIKDSASTPVTHKVAVTVTVTDAVSSLVVTPDSAAKILEHNTKKSAEVGRVTVTNADGTAPTKITYEVDGVDSKDFVVAPAKVGGVEVNEGVISANDKLGTLKVYNLTITAEIDNEDGTADLKGTAEVTYTVAKLEPLEITADDLAIRSDAAMGTEVGTVTVREVSTTTDEQGKAKPGEAVKNEDIDFILSGATAFAIDAGTDDKDNNNVVGVITTTRMLTSTDVGTHEMTVTAHGVAPQRTAQASFNILVTAGRAVPDPDVPKDKDDNPLPVPVEFVEDDTKPGNLLLLTEPSTAVGAPKPNVLNKFDLAKKVKNHEASFVYSLVDEPGWLETDEDNNLVVTGLVPDTIVKTSAAAAVADDPATTIDEAKPAVPAVFQRPVGSDGKFLVDGILSDTTGDEFADIVYDFTVNVKNGTSSAASVASFKVRLTVDVNRPTALVADAKLPSVHDFKAGLVDHDDDDETDKVKGYTVLVSEAERDVPMVLFGLNDLVSDADGDVLEFDLTGADAPHIVLDNDDGVWLTYLPPDANPGPRVNVIKVTASDGFNDATDNDVTTYIEISVSEVPPPPIFSQFVDITVAENSLVCSQVGVASGCSLAGLVDTADSFSIESGVDGGKTDYAIDITTGAITVVTAPNYEDSKSPAFFVNVKDDLGDLAALVSVRVKVTDVNEAPTITSPMTAWVAENANVGDSIKADSAANAADYMLSATDPEGATITFTASANDYFEVSGNMLKVKKALDAEKATSHTLTITATDGENTATQNVVISVGDTNDRPEFIEPVGKAATITVDENVVGGLLNFKAMDADGDDLQFEIREGVAQTLFTLSGVSAVPGEKVWQGSLDAKDGALNYEDEDYDKENGHLVNIDVSDSKGGVDLLRVHVKLNDLNDNPPVITGSGGSVVMVAENTARGTMLGDYSATDADDSSVITYSLIGANAKSFQISDAGVLMTLEALDADRPTPCGATGCSVEVIASDGENSVSMDVVITVSNAEDSVSTFKITKANPVPGVTMGEPNSALADTKVTSSVDKAPAERPGDLPATEGDGPDKFVETQWANWGTVLRIAVTSPSPDASCGNGNQCVFVLLESDNHDLKLEAYRSDTPAGATTRENLFIAAVKVVSGEGEGDEEDAATDGADGAVYKHGDGSVARLEADEEDEISIRLVGSTAPPITIDVENEKPEFGNFMPEHEAAFDDADVDYTFTIIDPVSGIPEPEDLPDVDGDGDYMPMVAVISDKQCKIIELDADGKRTVPKGYTEAKDLHADADLYCQGQPELRQVVDDRDFDEIDEGFDIDTKIVLRENEERFVSFIVCDAAGNCAMYTPDENNEDEALAQITIDTIKPGGEDGDKIEVRTGIKWDSTDNKYDDDRTYIQVIFEDLTPLNEDTIEVDDFVVEGHTIKSVKWYDFDANDDDADWSTRFDKGGPTDGETKDPMFRSINRSVFLELEDELAPDETPDVTVVPNGIEDSAGNEQDDGDKEADDWIAPSFTVTSIVSPRTPEGSSNVLAGDGDEVVITLTSDERIQQTRPNVSVTHVNAPASSVYTSTSREYCDNADGIGKGTRIRGEIRNSADCLDSDAASGGPLGTSIEKVSNTEWIITVNEPDATGYYSFYVSGQDRSEQNNPGSEGVAPDSLVKDFFERDGDVNSDDAHYFQGDINLSNPGVRVSGVQIEDTEPAVEFKTPLFVELDFTRGYIGDCDGITDNDEKKANCRNEKEEYAKDSFENVTVTSFVLNGVDMTDSVKTTDDKTFLVSIESINIGDHEIEIQAMDQAGNTLDEVLSIEFEVEERDPFSRRLNPGWNLVSLPGEPADSDISVVFGSNVEVRTVYTYDPIIPGGWMVAVRETLDSDWQGDLMDITARRGYWVLSDAIQDWEVSIPRLAGGAVGSGTPIQPPVIGLYAGWNLIPVVDVRGGALDDGKSISATAYLNSLDDGLDLARVLGFNTITNTWTTVLDPDDTSDDAGELRIGSGYWVFVREAASLVPGGIAQ